jgi:hypothetical protein
LGKSIAWARTLSEKGRGTGKRAGNLAVEKFNMEKSRFANYLGEIWGAV